MYTLLPIPYFLEVPSPYYPQTSHPSQRVDNCQRTVTLQAGLSMRGKLRALSGKPLIPLTRGSFEAYFRPICGLFGESNNPFSSLIGLKPWLQVGYSAHNDRQEKKAYLCEWLKMYWLSIFLYLFLFWIKKARHGRSPT